MIRVKKKFTPTPILAPSVEAKLVLHPSEGRDLETVEDPGGKVLGVWTKIHQTSNGLDSAVPMEVEGDLRPLGTGKVHKVRPVKKVIRKPKPVTRYKAKKGNRRFDICSILAAERPREKIWSPDSGEEGTAEADSPTSSPVDLSRGFREVKMGDERRVVILLNPPT